MATIIAPPPIAPARRDASVRRAAALAIASGIALVVLLVLASLVHGGGRAGRNPAVAAAGHAAQRAAGIATLPPPPVVSPTVFAVLDPDQARASNAALPFDPGKVAPARAFLFTGTVADRAAATACLAAAAWWEAGDDPAGERAVAQVVLNRVRHPAFPKTVCGVVFQGADRATGCQFTFACDGALARVPAAAAWDRARRIAEAALSGHVEGAVGTATHYHTDWVVPYWRDSLVKIAKVGTQIFYRWPGWWGTPPAFRGTLQPLEPLDPRLVALAGPEAAAATVAPQLTMEIPADGGVAAPVALPDVPRGALHGATVKLADGHGQFAVLLDDRAAPDSYRETAAALCRDRTDCLVWGWIDARNMPHALPFVPQGINGMTFLFRKSSFAGGAQPFWNCGQHPRRDADECIPGTAPRDLDADDASATVH